MASKISAMTAAAALTGAELLEVVQGGLTFQTTAQKIADLSPSKPTSPVTALAIASGVVAIDCSLGNYFTLAATAAMTSFTFSNLPGANKAETIMIKITQDATGGRVATWPASFKWESGTAGVLSTAASAKDILALTSFDQGTTWDATLSKGRA